MNKPTVLIIDDSKSTSDYVKELLEESGYEVITAPDGCRGIHCIESGNSDAVLLDIEMPGMSGLGSKRNHGWGRGPRSPSTCR